MTLREAIADVQAKALALQATNKKTLTMLDGWKEKDEAFYGKINESLEHCKDHLVELKEANNV